MELTTDYWILLLANGMQISLVGMLLYFVGLIVLVGGLLKGRYYWFAPAVGVLYTWLWVFLGLWWTTS